MPIDTTPVGQGTALVQVHVDRRAKVGINTSSQLRIIRIDRFKLDIGQASIIDDRCGPRVLILAPRTSSVDQMHAVVMPSIESAEVITE